MHAVDGKPDAGCCQVFNGVAGEESCCRSPPKLKRALAQQQVELPALADEDRFYNSTLKNFESNDLSIIPRKYRTLYKNLKAISL
jgi:hypothetical protein